jgi:hypothetical protein
MCCIIPHIVGLGLSGSPCLAAYCRRNLVGYAKMTEPKTMMATVRLRFVDKSTCPQTHTQKILQQCFIDVQTGQTEWVDVPFVGHISEVDQ